MSKKYGEISNKSDEMFKKVRIQYADVVSGLKLTFDNKKGSEFNYDNINGKSLKDRIKEGLLHLQTSSNILECTGLTYMQLVCLEARLITTQDSSNDQANFSQTLCLDTDIKETNASNRSHTGRKKVLYGIAEIIGPELPKLTKSEIMSLATQKQVEDKLFTHNEPTLNSNLIPLQSREEDSCRYGHNRTSSKQQDEMDYTLTTGLTFNNIFEATVNKPHQNRQFLEESKLIDQIDLKLKLASDESRLMPSFNSTIKDSLVDISEEVLDKMEACKWMKQMLESIDGNDPEYE